VLRSTLRVYVLGRQQPAHEPTSLTVLAEFKDGRGLERVSVDVARVEALSKRIGQLEAFITNGQPPFAAEHLTELGGALFDLIFTGRVKNLLKRALPADDEDGEVRPLELIVEDPMVGGWPWEYLYDAEDEKFLCRAFYPISRGIFSHFPRNEPIVAPLPVRVLFVYGASRADPDSNLAEQLNQVRRAFDRVGEGLIEMDVMSAIEPSELHARLNEQKYHILHFYGHAGFDAARDEGYLTFDPSDAVPAADGTDANGTNASTAPRPKQRLYAKELDSLLTGRRIRLVFLNACQTAVGAPTVSATRSSAAAAIMSSGVPVVVATQFAMPDNSANFFAAGVYKALATGRSVTEAMREGRTAMMFGQGIRHVDWGIPVLYASYPDLRIFKTSAAPGGA